MNIKETTPLSIDSKVIEFCRQINSNIPEFINIKPKENCRYRYCIENVTEHIEQNGGSMQTGWYIFRANNLYLTADAHAIWVSPEGKKIDITPMDDGANKIIFLKDDNVTFGTHRIPKKFFS